jgi:hypothetical protein
MATVDFGTDIACVTDVGPKFSFVSGMVNLGNALCRRLITQRGTLLYDLNYGTDIRARLNSGNLPSNITSLQADIENECEKDPRIDSCTAVVAFNQAAQNAIITLAGVGGQGPFTLVLLASQLTVQLLQVT